MARCPYLAEMKERFWRSSSNGTDNKKLTEEEGADELLKSVAMTTKSKQSTIARLAQPEPDDDEGVPMLPPPTITATITSSTSPTAAPPPPPQSSAVSTVVKRRMRRWMRAILKVLLFLISLGIEMNECLQGSKTSNFGLL
ncbi:hypothetical protein Ocin01_02973 [Orchesella cincta]|uniref:Uncharacterized protein n=1 Tax=Orchesella cincta TaxID=48709 RepID=A0A1D2NF08_ORCCI|nr:hypothetical protein Ocin01_02973 [Orchesella cincta]